MAIHKGGEWYTSFRFTENGNPVVRRIHRMEVQANDGHLYVLEGKDLPDKMEVNTGTGHRGKHLATIILNRTNFPPPPKGEAKKWPAGRDVLHIALGMTCFLLLARILATLAHAVP